MSEDMTGAGPDAVDCRIERRAAMTYVAALVEVTLEDIGDRLADAFETLERYMASRGIEPVGPSLVRYREVDDEHPFVVEAGWMIEEGLWIEAPFVADVLPKGRYVVGRHRGPYADLGPAMAATARWGLQQGVEYDVDADGARWSCWYECYLDDPQLGADGPEGLVDISLRIAGE